MVARVNDSERGMMGFKIVNGGGAGRPLSSMIEIRDKIAKGLEIRVSVTFRVASVLGKHRRFVM